MAYFGSRKADRSRKNSDDDSSDNDGEVYCICRKKDTDRFMIGCDNCEEWYHGDCISITADFAKKIKKFFCIACREKNPALEILYKEKKPSRKKSENRPEQKEVPKEEAPREDPEYKPELISRSKYFESEDEEDVFEPKSKVKKAVKPSVKRAPKRPNETRQASHKRPRQTETKPRKGHKERRSKDPSNHFDGPRQCWGPGCTEVSRPNSKYCSDECGLKLAKNRIYEILPSRIKQWQSIPSIADEMSSKALEQIREEQHESRRVLDELDSKQEELDKIIETGKLVIPLDEAEEEELDEKIESESELNIYCVSCGHEVSFRFAMRHMEKCFNKYEAQTSYGSIFKTKIDNLFCDFFNVNQSTYCKRLRILCPEHSKDAKIGDEEVCGAPLYANGCEETNTYCRVYKKKCTKHFCWEKIRRAEIDMERVQQWLKIDDLFEKEQKMRYNMANRGGVLSLMLHQTLPVGFSEND
ncbi:CXXC-type zinc finger protein 1 [Halotydeus destructor]|nr:CXXC-type zinc finger protein 1 [Halotydeus destructor]